MADEGQDSLREMTSATPPDEGEEERRLQDPRSGEERDPLERSTVEDKRMANEVRQETQLEANEGLVDEDPDAAAAETLDNPDTKSALDVVVDKKSDNEEGEHPERHELEKNESGGELQSNRSESLSDGSSSASSDVAAVAAASSRSEREGLELDLQQNDKENDVDQDRSISPNRRRLAAKPTLPSEVGVAEDTEQPKSPEQTAPVAQTVSCSTDELSTEDFIAGVLFDAKYLGSTQMFSSQSASKSVRMTQAHEAVSRVKQPDGESQPRIDIYILVSTQKITVINALDNCALMEHPLRTISYIADIGNILVLMARRKNPRPSQSSVDSSSIPSTPTTPSGPPSAPTVDTFTPQSPTAPGGGIQAHAAVQSPSAGNGTPPTSPVAEIQETVTTPVRQSRIICHVLESENARNISRAIGQAFNVAYHEFLRTHGIEEEGLAHSDYADVLSVQKMPTEDLDLFSDKNAVKEVVIEKKKNEMLGVMLMESGWGSMVPTAVIAHMAKHGPAARTSRVNVGDQIICVNGTSLVGLSLSRCIEIVKECRSMQQVKLTFVPCPPVVQVVMIRPDVKYSLGFSVQNGIIVSILRGGIAERGGVRVGHRIIELNGQSMVNTPHERIVETLATATGEINMKTMPTFLYRLITGEELPQYI